MKRIAILCSLGLAAAACGSSSGLEDKDALIDEIWERAANEPIERFIFHSLPEGGPFQDWIADAMRRALSTHTVARIRQQCLG